MFLRWAEPDIYQHASLINTRQKQENMVKIISAGPLEVWTRWTRCDGSRDSRSAAQSVGGSTVMWNRRTEQEQSEAPTLQNHLGPEHPGPPAEKTSMEDHEGQE